MATWNSRGLRGSTLEEFINHSNERYSEMGACTDAENPDTDYSGTYG